MTRTLLFPTLFLLLLGGFCFWLSAAPPAKKSITFASPDDIKTLDPGAMSWMGDIRAAMGLWEGLASYDPKTLAPIPATAESWTVSPDGLTYTFKIRPTARWSNGDPVTAQDFLFAWQRNLQPVTAGDYAAMFYHIQGAEDYANALGDNKPADFSQVGVSAPDTRTIVIHLNAPCTYFLDLVAFPPYYPLNEKAMAPFLLNRKVIDAGGAREIPNGYNGAWTHPPNLVTNGPFKLAEWKFQRELILQRNPNYWERAAVKTELIRLVAYKDSRAGYLAYENGNVDVMSWVPPDFGKDLLDQVKAGQRADVQFRPVFGTYYYIFNCQKKPFDDPRVRRALALVIDKDDIVNHITEMGQLPVGVLVPPDSIVGYHGPAGLAENIPEAQKLLAEAGYPDGRGLPVLEILYTNESAHGKIAQAIGQMWEKHLKLHISYRGLERSSFGSERRAQDFTIARGGWYGDYADPTTWLDLARTGNGNNDGKYSNPDFDALMKKSDAETDPAKRFALLRDAEAILVEKDFPFIPLYQYADGYLFDPHKIGGLDLNVRLLTQFKYLYRVSDTSALAGATP